MYAFNNNIPLNLNLFRLPFFPQLLRIQKKAAKKEQLAREELERRHLSVVLQVQHLLQGLQQEHVRRDLLAGNNLAPHLPAQRLHSLNQLATLLGAERDSRLRYSSATTADEWQTQSKLAVMGKKQQSWCAQPENQHNISPRHQSSKLWCWRLIKKKMPRGGLWNSLDFQHLGRF